MMTGNEQSPVAVLAKVDSPCMQSLGKKKRKWEREWGREGGREMRGGEGRAEKGRTFPHFFFTSIDDCIVVPLTDSHSSLVLLPLHAYNNFFFLFK